MADTGSVFYLVMCAIRVFALYLHTRQQKNFSMNRFPFLLILLSLSLSACTLRVNEPSQDERVQITNEILALTSEIRAAAERADADGLFQHHSAEPNAFHINDGRLYTKNDLLNQYRQTYAGVARQEINIGSPTVNILNNDLVLVTSQGRFTSTSKSGSSISGDVAWTYLWQREAGIWTLLHAHQSFAGPIAPAGN